jgi:ABC-2 type transport system permease protein
MNIINYRLISLIRKEFIQIVRDPRTLIMILGIPIMQLLLMGYAATNDVRNVALAVFDQDRSPAARRLLDAYRAADYFLVAYDVQSEDELQELIDSGKARAGLIIPPDYGTKVTGNGTAQVAFVLDGSDPTVGSTALSAAQLIAQEFSTQILNSRLQRIGQSSLLSVPIEAHTNVWYNPDLVSAYFMVPGVIGQILYSLTSILTATAVVRERERGTIEQLIVTPIRSWELMTGKIIPYIILAFFNTLEVLALGSWLFHVPINSSLWMILLLSGLFLFSGLGIGLVASTIANTQQEAMLAIFMTLLPSVFLSGFFFPIEAMPKVLQWISYVVPIRYYLVIIRSLLIKGVGASHLQDQIIALILFAVFIMTIAILRFRKRLD